MNYTKENIRLDFINDIKLGDQFFSNRQFIRYSFNDSKETILSPLPNFSTENLAQASEQFEKTINEENPQNIFGSVQWAKDLLLLQDERITKYDGMKPLSNILIVLDEAIDYTRQPKFFWGDEYTYLKIKIGRLSPEIENSILRIIVEQTAETKLIRLDGNNYLTPAQLDIILEGIDFDRIDYIEEPFQNMALWNNYYIENNIPLAVDDLYRNYENYVFEMFEGISAIVIKPTISFGYFETLNIIQAMCFKNIEVIISSSYDHPLSMKYLKYLAIESNCQAGLNTLNLFKQ